MKVLIIHPQCYHYGGAETVIIQLTKYLQQQKVEVSILSRNMPEEVEKELLDTEILVPREAFNHPEKSDYELRRFLHKHVEEWDVINPHTPFSELYLYPLKKPCVWMCNEPPASILYQNRLAEEDKKRVVESITNIMVSDGFNAERIQKFYGVESTVNLYGVEHEFYEAGNPESSRLKFGIDENRFVVLHVGHLQEFKNQLESLVAVGKVIGKIPNVLLVLAGWDGFPYAQAVRSYIIQNPMLKDHVLLTGNVSREDTRDLYHLADLVVFPFKEQGGWLSFFEALCVKKPVLVGSNMLARKVVEQEKMGTVVTDFAKGILNVYQCPDKYKRLENKGFKWVKENVSWQKFGAKMLDTYREALEKEAWEWKAKKEGMAIIEALQ
jgi:glycosyltransferase involved in cell wall biosynthesis